MQTQLFTIFGQESSYNGKYFLVFGTVATKVSLASRGFVYHCKFNIDFVLSVDFCQRKICRLLALLERKANNAQKETKVQQKKGSEVNPSNSDELHRQEYDIDFNVAMKCLSLVRYVMLSM